MRVFILLVALFCVVSAKAGELDNILKGWNLSITPIEKIEELKEQYYDPDSYKDLRIKWDRHIVSKTNGKLQLNFEDNPISSNELRVGDITFRSEDKGEFGGELGYKHNGSYFSLMKGNVRKLILDGKRLYILEGLDHMISRGAVYMIPDAENPTPPERITLLPETPKAALLTDDGLLVIVGSDGLYFVSKDYFSIAYWNAFWSGIYLWGPTSIVEYEDKFLIGLPKGIAVIELLSPIDPPNISLYMTNEFNKSIQPTAKASAD